MSVFPKHTDILVIGGGASGLSAAISASLGGARVTIAEKLPRVGKKILATGGGRCNLGNVSTAAGHYYGSVDVCPVLAQFPGEIAFFEALGLYTVSDEVGRLYPASDTATSVLDALRLACDRRGVHVCCGFSAVDIADTPGGFVVSDGDGNEIFARRVILATGGRAAPKLGTSGDGYRLAGRFGHDVARAYPALAPIGVDPAQVRGLKGLRVDAGVTAYRAGACVGDETGQVQFLADALSGICVMNHAAKQPDMLSLDLIPWCYDPVALVTDIWQNRADYTLSDLLTGILPKRVGEVLMKSVTDLPLSACGSVLDDLTLRRLAKRLKDWQLQTRPMVDWDAAQATSGGVTDVCQDTLESSRCLGLYFAGELLDVHADCGGFHLRWAWASGYVAGMHAARGVSS